MKKKRKSLKIVSKNTDIEKKKPEASNKAKKKKHRKSVVEKNLSLFI